MSGVTEAGGAARTQSMLRAFAALYGGRPSSWVRAPGRGELLGTDTDDHLGYVMTMAIHLDTWIAFRPSGSSRVRVHSMNTDASTEYVLGEEPAEQAGTWDRYVDGVSQTLARRGSRPGGVDAVIHSTVPLGGGLSSSASLEVAAALMFMAAGSAPLTPRETAEACQQAENQCVGVACGILDQYSSVFGKEGTALLLDCRSITHVEVNIPPDIKVVICDTKYPRTLAGSEYAKRRWECDEGTRLLKEKEPRIRTLRDVNPQMFAELQGAVPEPLRKRCRFIIEENQRVIAFMGAVIANDQAAMRELCSHSFSGMRDKYEKTVPAMERMHEAMMSGPGVVGARQSGGGFGGCMTAFVKADAVPAFEAHVQKVYKEKTGTDCATHATAPSAGAGLFEP